MALVKCNHCNKETINKTGKCRWCNKEIDKNLEEREYKFVVNEERLKKEEEIKLKIKLIKDKKRKLNIILIIILILMNFNKAPAIAYLLFIPIYIIGNKIISKSNF